MYHVPMMQGMVSFCFSNNIRIRELGKCNICNLVCDNRSIKQVKAFCIVYSAFEVICAAFTIVKQLLRVDCLAI